MTKIVSWLRQPTTVAGISALLGTGAALLLKQIPVGAAIPLLTGALVSMILPDNTGAKTDAQALASAVVAGAVAGKIDPLILAPQAAALANEVEAALVSK